MTSEHLERWLAPISAGQPAGEDLRYDPRADGLREQIGKLEREGSASVDWQLVVRVTESLLEGASKDLWFASYLALGWCHTKGAGDLVAGVRLWRELYARYDQTVYPSRSRGRANALLFLLERCEVLLQEADAAHAVFPVVSSLSEELSSLKSLARAGLGDHVPAFSGVERLIAQAQLSLAEPAPPSREVVAEDAGAGCSQAPDIGDGRVGAAPSDSGPNAASTDPSSLRAEAPAVPAEWLTEIAEDCPCGEDLSDSEAYLDLRHEVIGRLEGLRAAPPDWPRVAARAGHLLSSQAKDLTLACYLGAALFEVDGLMGLSRGLSLIEALFDKYGDMLHPRRARRRAHALEWLGERLALRLAERADLGVDRTLLAAAREAAERLESAFAGLGNHAPSWRPLREALAGLAARPAAESLPDPAVRPLTQAALTSAPSLSRETPSSDRVQGDATPPAGTPAPAQPADAAAIAPALAPDFDRAGPKAFLARVSVGLGRAAEELRKGSLADPVPYRLARIAAWISVSGPPPERQGKTQLVGPDRSDRRALEKLMEEAAWVDLIGLAEPMLARHRYWLDLSFYTATALKGLGEGHSGAWSEVEAQSRAFARTIEPVVTALFRDGTALASDATRKWLMAGEKSGGPIPNHPTDGETASPVWIDFQQCLRDLQGVSLLVESKPLLMRMTTERERFRARLALASTLAHQRDDDVAFAMLDSLDADVDTYRLAQWEPSLACQVVEAKIRCLANREGPHVSPELRRLRGRLAMLQPERLVSGPMG